MAKIQMENVNKALSDMDDFFWKIVAARCSALSKQAKQLLVDFSTTHTQLSVTLVHIVEAKYNGYIRLSECTNETAQAQIIEENKAQINALLHEKENYAKALTAALSDLQIIIDETLKMGEVAKAGDVE